MSAAERAYKARREAKRRQGFLTAELKEKLKKDVLLLLDGAKHPKTWGRIEDELIVFLGWNEDQIKGPEPWVGLVLHELDHEEIIQSRGLRTESYAVEFWR
jgi:hypothetical protein